MSRHFLRVHPNDERPEAVVERIDHVYAILIEHSTNRRSIRSDFDLPRWIETFNELAEERVGVNNFAPSVAVICSELDHEELDKLDSVGAVVIEKSQLARGVESFAALFEHLMPDIDARQHLQNQLDVDPDVELDDDTIKFLEGESEGITEDDRQELLDILGTDC